HREVEAGRQQQKEKLACPVFAPQVCSRQCKRQQQEKSERVLDEKSRREVEPLSGRVELAEKIWRAALGGKHSDVGQAVEIGFRQQMVLLRESDHSRLKGTMQRR